MTAEKLLSATFGKFVLTIAGIDFATLPVARQLLLQYGRSASVTVSMTFWEGRDVTDLHQSP